MARSISQIQSQIMAQITTNPVLGTQLTSPSQVAIYNVFSYIVATALSIEEQLRDIFQTEIETDIANAPPGTPQWIVGMLKYFQYNATVPQVATLDLTTYTISYPVVNPAYNVIAQAAVITDPNKVVVIKVAGSNPAVCFDNTPGVASLLSPIAAGPTMEALVSYLDSINFAGVEFSIINVLPDLFLIGANIYYDGQYASVIQPSVNTAISNYLATLPFNGLITLNGSASNPGLIDAITAVPGVEDIDFTNVSIRPYNITDLSLATVLVNNQQLINRNSGTYSGRAILDPTYQGTIQGTTSYILNFYVNS
jgi:hypothetical protein